MMRQQVQLKLHLIQLIPMKKQFMTWLLAITTMSAFAQQATVTGPDSFLKVNVSVKQGIPVYSVTYKDKTILEDSPLGFIANVGDFSRDMTFTGQKENKIDKTYTQDRIKQSQIHYQANELTCTFTNKEKKNINSLYIRLLYPTSFILIGMILVDETRMPAYRGPSRFQHPF